MKIHSRFAVSVAMAVLATAVVQAEERAVPVKPDAKPAASAAAATEASVKPAETKPAEAKCEYVTGSRIRHDPPVDCGDGSPGSRTFTSEELQSTGELTMAEALRKLDPRFY
jgi:uncharacterized low-complexity protein